MACLRSLLEQGTMHHTMIQAWCVAQPPLKALHSSWNQGMANTQFDVSDATGYGEFPTTDCIPDTVNDAKFVRDLYEMVDDNAGNLCPTTLNTAHRT